MYYYVRYLYRVCRRWIVHHITYGTQHGISAPISRLVLAYNREAAVCRDGQFMEKQAAYDVLVAELSPWESGGTAHLVSSI